MKWTRTFTKENSKQLTFFLLGMVALFVLDLSSKWIVETFLEVGEQIAVIPNFFYITKSYNTGMAFSLGADLPPAVGRTLNIVISLTMSVAILYYWILNDEKFNNFQRVIAMLLSAGAVGNLIDRAFYWEAITGFDGVIDFLQFYLTGGPEAGKNYFNPFATFNLADSYLVIGIFLMIILLIVDMVKEAKGNKSEFAEDPRLAKASASSSNAPEASTLKEEKAEVSYEEVKSDAKARGGFVSKEELLSIYPLSSSKAEVYFLRLQEDKLVKEFEEESVSEVSAEETLEEEAVQEEKTLEAPVLSKEEAAYQTVKAFVLTQEKVTITGVQKETKVPYALASASFKRLQEEGVIGERVGNRACIVHPNAGEEK